MGTWSADILGGDHPMDVLGLLADLIGYEHDDAGLYPLEFNADEVKGVRFLLESHEAAILSHKWNTPDLPVLAAAYLATGAVMPEAVREGALQACRVEADELRTTNADGWSKPEERIAVLENHMKLIEQHEPGKITPIQHKGLFETLGIV